MRFRHHPPDPRLSALVQGYLELEDLHLADPVRSADFPERTVRMMLLAGQMLAGPSADALRPLPPVMLTRFSLQPQSMVLQGLLRGLMVELYPWGARQLLGWSADQAPGALDAALSASAWSREVVALLQLGQWDAAREALEAQLLTLAGLQDEPGSGVQAARQIYRSSGVVRVAELAEELNLSARTLERQFAQQVGVGAKTLARVVRFDTLNTRIRTDPAVLMADLTYELGFFDQAHLIREFKALSSLTPGAFAAIAARRQSNLDLLQDGSDQYLEVGPAPDAELELA